MPSLAELQNDFLSAMTAQTDEAFLRHVRDEGAPAATRLKVYRNNIFASLTQGLGDLYPVIERLVGERFFSAVAKAYIEAYPPDSARLIRYGAEFAAFLRHSPPAAKLPYLADVAALEWAWQHAYLAAEADPVSPETLAGLSPEEIERLQLELHPSASLVASPYPIIRIWEANQDGGDPDMEIDLGAGGETALVIRPGTQVEVRRLTPGGAALSGRLMCGDNLGEAYQAALGADPHFELQTYLAGFLSSGSFVGYRLSELPNRQKQQQQMREE